MASVRFVNTHREEYYSFGFSSDDDGDVHKWDSLCQLECLACDCSFDDRCLRDGCVHCAETRALFQRDDDD